MAATYSSFMTTRYYSPVFNTALFDGPLRIYFSQSYESSALKIYHILQTQHEEIWQKLKEYSARSKEHVFMMMYPEQKDLSMVFADENTSIQHQTWEEGLAIGFVQPLDDTQLAKLLDIICKTVLLWIDESDKTEVIA